MTHYLEYIASLTLEPPNDVNAFYTFLMAAIYEADTDNLEKLKSAFPEIVKELQERYNAPGGLLEGEVTQ